MRQKKNYKQKTTDAIEEIKEKIITLHIHPIWFRRIFHTFAASFLIYYKIPNDPLGNILKIIIPSLLLLLVIIIEYFRITRKINSTHFYGLRRYEQKRPASYLYFGIGILLSLFCFPQQIAIPCILCACFADPIIGELRYRTQKNVALLIGLLICFLIFLLTWNTQPPTITLPIALLGATMAILGENTKFRLIDDDFLIQILPAINILTLWYILQLYGIHILPETSLHPI